MECMRGERQEAAVQKGVCSFSVDCYGSFFAASKSVCGFCSREAICEYENYV